VLCALKVERGRTIQIKRSHAMQNSPDVVQQTNQHRRIAEPSATNQGLSRSEAGPRDAADFSLSIVAPSMPFINR
jgi:hypothetical protein